MVFTEYGAGNEKTVILLHGGGLAQWGYEAVAKLLADSYHIILPVLDGHGDSDRNFESIEDNAGYIIDFIDRNFDGKVFAVGGLSLGGQIALEMLSQRKDICQYAFIESALVLQSKLTAVLTKPMIDLSYFLISKPWFARLQFDYLKINPDLFQQYYIDSCKITKENMISFLKANSLYTLKPGLKDTEAKVLIMAGEKEVKSIIESSHIIKDTMPNSRLEIIPELYHGQLSMNKPEKYISRFEKHIK
ncbi:MAG: alpha/beta hydrolase [Oscillospiraceae bacterium]|nr:alpha/beta hydrolase [Oscillospiraceae bacterium]